MSKRLKIARGSGNLFHDIGFAPEEAENLKFILAKIHRAVSRKHLRQSR